MSEFARAGRVAQRAAGGAGADAGDQATGGNRAISSLLRARPDADAPTHTAVPDWSRAQLRAIQVELKRLGLYPRRVDGRFGSATQAALVEAFGGHEWRYLPVDEITERVRDASPVTGGQRGEHQLRYGEMFRDGVLDITLGVGYDEYNWSRGQVAAIKRALLERKFRPDPADGALLMHLGGHDVGPRAAGEFYVRRDALTYHPPAGEPRKVHAVVRLLDGSSGKNGADNADAFADGMIQSDVAAYAGHGRYGSGPDFDRNFTSLDLIEDNGMVTRFPDYGKMEEALREQGRPHGRSAWEQFLWLDKRHRVFVTAAHGGNIVLNPQDMHSHEFGGRLLYWTLQRDGRLPATGRGGALATGAAAAKSEHPYRVLLFDGCTTKDYVRSIRSTPGFDAESADVIASRRVQNWGDYGRMIASFLDDVIGQQSAEEIVRGLGAQEQTIKPAPGSGDAFAAFGVEDNAAYQ